MPRGSYRRRPRFARYNRPRRGYSKGKGKKGWIARTLRAGLSPCGPTGYVPDENKAFDGVLNATDLVSTGTIWHLLLPGIGDDMCNRDGRETMMTSIQFEFTLDRVFSAVTSSDGWIVSIVYDMQTNGAAPTFADIYGTFGATGSTPPVVGVASGVENSIRSLQYRNRFKVIKEWRGTNPANSDTTSYQSSGHQNPRTISFYTKLPCLKTIWRGAGTTGISTIADISSGSLYAVAAANAASSPTKLKFTSRVRYMG